MFVVLDAPLKLNRESVRLIDPAGGDSPVLAIEVPDRDGLWSMSAIWSSLPFSSSIRERDGSRRLCGYGM